MLCVNAKGTESDPYRGGGAAVPLSSTESRMWEAGRAPLKVLPKGAAPLPRPSTALQTHYPKGMGQETGVKAPGVIPFCETPLGCLRPLCPPQ